LGQILLELPDQLEQETLEVLQVDKLHPLEQVEVHQELEELVQLNHLEKEV